MSNEVKYTKYDEATGDIICHFVDFPENLSLHGSCIEGHWDWEVYRIVDGVAVEKDAAEIEAREIYRSEGKLRNERNALLRSSDWTQMPDAPVDSAAWATYRQQLRDLPANTTDPRDVTWPVPPS